MLIVPQIIKIKWNPANKKYYENKNYIYTKMGEEFEINILDLPLSAKNKVKYICDYCSKECETNFNIVNYNRDVQYKSELKNCCGAHSHCWTLKNQEISMERYGVKTPSQTREIKDKIIKTNQKKYGANSATLNREIQEKIKQTNLERYGVENVYQSEEIKNKIKQSMINKYGVEHQMLLDETKEKIKQTSLERYGVEHYSQTKECKEQIRQTSFEKYGVESYTKTNECKEKTKNTNLERYGVEYYSQTRDFKERIKIINLEKYGTKFIFKSENDKNKIKLLNLEKYGVEYVFQSKESKEKIRRTNLERYGVEYPFQSKDIREKAKQTNLKRYGVENYFQINVEQRIEKMLVTMHQNETGVCSAQQKYICDLYGIKPNYPVDLCSLDIAFPEEMVYIEYDGGGHDKSVKCGWKSQGDFNTKEFRRKNYLQNRGWSLIRIISKKDWLPLDNIILSLVQECKNYLNTGHSWIEIDIDKSEIRSHKLNKTIELGELRKIFK